MRDDLLKEELMRHAHDGADAAAQPGAAVIRRRARRHAQRVAALTAAGVLVAVGLGVGIGLRGDHATPTVDQPKPPVTSLAPVKPPATTPAPTPATKPHPTTTTGPVAAGPPPSFVTLVGSPSPSAPPPRVAVVATSTGRVVRYLTGPASAGGDLPTRPALSPDRAWVYYSLTGAGGKAATYRVPLGGGPATKVTGTVGISLAVSPDGSKLLLDARNGPRWRYGLVVRDLASGRERFMAFPFPQAGDIFGLAWSPDSRRVALVRGPITDDERFPTQLFLLEVASGRWRTAVGFAAGGPAPESGEAGLTWPAPRRVAFVARVADSDTAPARYQLVGVDPQTGKLTPMAVLASDPSAIRHVRARLLDFDARGRYLLYGVAGLHLTTRWLDTSGRGAPVEISRFNALSDKETHAYEGGAW